MKDLRFIRNPSSLPAPADSARAAAGIEEWLRMASGKLAKGFATRLAKDKAGRALLEAVFGNSPYLSQSLLQDVDFACAALATTPDSALSGLVAGVVPDTLPAATPEFMAGLRLAKRRAALIVALADIAEVWSLDDVTRALSDFADRAVDLAVAHVLRLAASSGTFLAKNDADICRHSGFIILGMGKLGGHELNYSSDIDLIVLYDEERFAVRDRDDAQRIAVRLTQSLLRILDERTSDGYVFRTDLRLRPDPGATPVAMSTLAAETYYEGMGQNWERAAMIKARPIAGDRAAGDAFLARLRPYVWRKHLDFAAIRDIHSIKRQIDAHRGGGSIALAGHNLKLGRGGIREIEFFAQTQQLIAGGRNPDLRDRDTLTTLDKLEHDRWIDAVVRDDMKDAYGFLRTVEHRLQMVNDEQTQVLPAERAELERFARFLGYANRGAFAKVLLDHLGKVQRHYTRLFETAPGGDKPEFVFPPDADDRKSIDCLAELGFRAPLEASSIIRQWLSAGHRSLKGEAARSHLEGLLPVLLEHVARTDNPGATLVLFDHFLANLHTAVRLLSLLRQKPDLIALITLVLGIAPRLADTLARNPQVMDALVDPSFFGTLPDDAELGRRLNAALAQSRYDEDLLERIRMFGLEYMFLIGVRILSGTVTARQAGEAFARLADAVIRAVHNAVADSFAATHGHIRGEQTAVLAMGKLGGREMTASSDLDLILVYDFNDKQPESSGKRPLYGAQYFARLTQRLINALTAQTNYGALYDVDMRLRPSGRAGPLATQIGGFTSYQETEAWTWEHMALTRARVVSASSAFGARVEQVIREILRRPRDAELIAGDVVEMRGAIIKEKGDRDRWDLKYAAGGLVDLEFIAQYLQLVHAHRQPDILDTATARVFDKAWQLNVLPVEEAEVLRPAVQFYHDLTQILRLCLPGPFDPKTAGAGLLRLLARAADVPDFATLDATLIETQAKVRASFVRILGRTP